MKQVRPKKNLGQHFLTDLGIAKRIADTVDACPDIPVLEIGPGMGVMTQYLYPKDREFKCVEIDKESVEYLRERFEKHDSSAVMNRTEEGTEEGAEEGTEGFEKHDSSAVMNRTEEGTEEGTDKGGSWIISDDFLRMDLKDVFGGRQFVLTGNYPYDISSQIFFKMLEYKDLIPCCTGMIQREVALRIASKPGNKAYGILSVLIQAWYDTEYLFTVEPTVFNPPPKVQSAVIRMTRNEVTDLGCDEALFKRVVKTVFNQRRKMLRVSLKQIFNSQNPARPEFFEHELMTKRPEQLTVEQFVELTNLVEKEAN